MSLSYTDPWSTDAPTKPDRRVPVSLIGAGAVAAVALGAFAPALLSWRAGHRRHALVVILVAGVFELALVLVERWRKAGPAGFGAPLAVAVASVALAPAAIGRATTAGALLAVAVAHGCLLGWPHISSAAARSSHRVAALALPLLVAAQLSWVRDGRRIVTASALVVALGLVALHHLRPGVYDRVDAVLRRALVAISGALGAAVLFVLAALTLYLPGLISRCARRAAHPRRPAFSTTGTWTVRTAGVADVRRDARRPFATTEAPDRHRRHLVGVVVALPLLLVAALVVKPIRDRNGGAPAAPAPSAEAASRAPIIIKNWNDPKYRDLPAFAGADWADDLQREENRLSGSVDGRYIHVSGGIRRSLPPPACPCRRVKVWLYGGSAAFGIGQRDDHTIASSLVEQAASQGLSLDIDNMGVPGFTIWQDFEKFSARLAFGSARPDIAIFYDGFNDVTGTVFHTGLHGPDRWAPTLLTVDETVEYNQKDSPTLAPYGGPAAIARLAIDKYDGVRQRIQDLATGAGIPVLFVFQPDAFGSRHQVSGFAELAGTTVERMMSSELAQTFAEASKIVPPGVRNLRSLLDDEPSMVFTGPVHTNEKGASLVATAILPDVVRVLDGQPTPTGTAVPSGSSATARSPGGG